MKCHGAWALVALVGCGEGGVDASLADLENVALVVYVEGADIGENLVTLQYDGWVEKFPDECPTLGDDFAGRFRGREMSVRDPGGKGESDCELPTLEIEQTAVPSNNVVEVGDGSLTITATFAAGALETRIASHESWRFARGAAVAVDWSHGEDLVGAMPSISIGGRDIAGTVSASQIAFVIPDDAPTGEVALTVRSNDTTADEANVCENAATCRATQAAFYHHAATIE